ncbi:MAG: carbamoyl-phosphate synthase, partial [Polyangiaceae bacterium]|nr:carbamoyl-phosphate synthase [Polyangiaceae bacterium]
LSKRFRLYLPDLEVVYTLLNKWRLYQVCMELGIDVPPTWLPNGENDLDDARRHIEFPAVIKPQTQVFMHPHKKGRFVYDPNDLRGLYREFRATTRHSQMLLEFDPDAVAPLVQSFVEMKNGGVYGVSGFIDETGELFVARASRKVLQWPPRLGVGLCFEDVELIPSVAADVARLCRHVGYFGPFEVEFVEHDGHRWLIDFNPRFFGQMAFDISRGADLPYFAYLASTGQREELGRGIAAARKRDDKATPRVYCHRIDLEFALRLQLLAGRLSRKDCEHWRNWLARNRVTDAVIDREDWGPGLAEATAGLFQRAIHPRSTWRFAREGVLGNPL